MSNPQPFFIISNPRSGSSLLRLMCESHSKLTVPPECGLIEWWHNKYGNWKIEDLYNGRFKDFCIDLVSSRKFESWKFDFKYFKFMVEKKRPENYADLVKCIYLTYGKRKNDILRWGDKNNYYITKIDLLISIFPQAQFIHIVRDGRDVAASYLELNNINTKSRYKPELSNNIIEIAEEWRDNNKNTLSFFNDIPKNQKMTIRFEDLIIYSEMTCKKICSFLGVDYDCKMLQYYTENKKYVLEPAETIDWKKKTLQMPDVTRIGRYKDELTIDQIEIINKISSDVLNIFNYEI